MIYILGAGNMAREVLAIYEHAGRFNEVAGFIEENCQRADSTIRSKPVMDASVINTLSQDSIFIGAMGSPRKKKWIDEIELKGFYFDIVVHPSVIMGDDVNFGEGCIISPGVILTCNVKIKKQSIINIGTTISHDCTIGNFVTVGPGANIGGNVTIGDECWIGIGVTIIDKVSIGKGSYIGAGAVVTKDIPENVLAVGVPAKPAREMTDADWRELV